MRALCTTSKVNGKVLQRSEFHQYIEQNAKRVAQNPKAYKKRQAIVEHPYGTIKRQWGFNHITTKRTKLRASADVGLIFIAYNLTRIWNIIKEANNIFYQGYMLIIVTITSILRPLETTKIRKTKKQIIITL